MKNKLTICSIISLILWLGACSQTAVKPSEQSPDEDNTAAAVKAASKPEPEEIIYRPFPTDTLYSLLVAEFAAKRQQYTVALGHYLDQAHQTRDPGIVAHATHLARYLKADRAAMDASLLWVSVDPDSIEANFMAAVALTRNKQPVSALNHMAKVGELGGKTNYTSISNYAIHLSEDIQKQLLANYNSLIKKHPENTDLLLASAMILAQLKDNDKALATVQQVLDQSPDHVQSMTLEATLLIKMQRQNQAFKRISKYLTANPNSKRLRLQYARLLTRHDLQKAQEQFGILVEQAPTDADLIFSLALINKENKLNQQAKQRFQQLLDLNSRTSEANFYLGQLEEVDQHYDLAIAHYKLVTPGIDFVPAVRNIVKLLVMKLQVDKALELVAESRLLAPQDAIRLYLIETDLLAQYHRYEESYTLLSKALGEFPNNDNLYYARAMVSEKMNNIDLLEADLRTILTHNPKSTLALNALGYTLADRTDRYSEASAFIAEALKIQPEDPAILDSMGWVQYRLGNYEQALKLLHKAHNLMADHEISAHLGEVLWVSGQHEAAKTIWQKALNKQPQSPVLKKVLERFKPGIQAPDLPAEPLPSKP